MKFLLFSLVLVLFFSCSAPFGASGETGLSENVEIEYKQWEYFKQTYNKSYSDVENQNRLIIFKENMKHALQLQNLEQGTAIYGITPFSDLTKEEFESVYLRSVVIDYHNYSLYDIKIPFYDEVNIPKQFDWRNVTPPVVTPVYDQGFCGSCWAFSATETIESYWALKGNNLTKLSMQQIIDCDMTSFGCFGGWTYLAYEYVISTGGIESYYEYPYFEFEGICQFNRSKIVSQIKSYVNVTNDLNEKDMLLYLYNNGPLSVCLDASTWSSYQSGIIKTCGDVVNHCVQITGYGNDNGTDYWIVRNSWGTSWGMDGYLKIFRGNNTCQIARYVTAVIV